MALLRAGQPLSHRLGWFEGESPEDLGIMFSSGCSIEAINSVSPASHPLKLARLVV